ncbi:hypothetical protein [Paenibacillus sp. S150]|uniref:hypothetical protein n=1 Tax=Paenibacillus sp. S150 TaxID=2749826 RepID=UPI001C5A4379|nr:hypothetical protein [Paenibacillus sp. S150]MBW4085125.1 hypothetical protein [Paenibacillus sp. S150]
MYYTFEPQGYDTAAITLGPDGPGEQPRGPLSLQGLKGNGSTDHNPKKASLQFKMEAGFFER